MKTAPEEPARELAQLRGTANDPVLPLSKFVKLYVGCSFGAKVICKLFLVQKLYVSCVVFEAGGRRNLEVICT